MLAAGDSCAYHVPANMDDPKPQDASHPIAPPPNEDRPASAALTEHQLETEVPTIKALDHSPALTPHDPYAAIRLRAYQLYVASYALAVIGGQVQTVALSWEIYQKWPSPMSLGFIGGIQVIPLFLFALPAGHLSDIMSRKKLLIIVQWLLAFWGIALACLSHYGAAIPLLLPAMYGVVLLNAVTLTFGRPARSALLPQLVPEEVFSNAVTWNATVFELSSMIGPALGGLIVAYRSSAQAYLLNGFLLIACAVLTSQFPHVVTQRRKGEAPGFRALLAGVSFVWSKKIFLATMCLDLFAVLLGGAVYLLPVFAKDILHVGATGFGWLRAAPSIGAVSMALILAHRPPMKHAGRTLLSAVAGFGVATLVFGITKHYWLAFIMLIATGACDNISVVVRQTLFQLLTPDSMRGRVSAVNQVFIGSSNELGGMESGLTAAWWGPVASVVFGGIGTLVTVLLTAILSPELRKLGKLEDARAETLEDELADQPPGQPRGFEVIPAGENPGRPVE